MQQFTLIRPKEDHLNEHRQYVNENTYLSGMCATYKDGSWYNNLVETNFEQSPSREHQLDPSDIRHVLATNSQRSVQSQDRSHIIRTYKRIIQRVLMNCWPVRSGDVNNSQMIQHDENCEDISRDKGITLKAKSNPDNTSIALFGGCVNSANLTCSAPQEFGVGRSTSITSSVFACDICNKEFRNVHLLVDHMCCHRETREINKSNFYLIDLHIAYVGAAATNPFRCISCTPNLMFCSYSVWAKHMSEHPLVCDLCSRQFQDSSALMEHSTVHIQERLIKCDVCNKTFSERFALHRHIALHFGEKQFRCHVCDKEFVLKDSFDKHVKGHLVKKQYKCLICNQSFTSNSKLKQHLLCHTNERPHECEVCGKCFKMKHCLYKHTRTHTTEYQYKCEICERMLKTSKTLKEHLHTHSTEKTYTCKLCQKSFKAYCALRRHLFVHTQERPHRCQICNMTFQQSCTLKRHQLVHTLEKPYKCHLCDSAFTQDSALKGHIQTHVEGRPYVCEICSKAFRRKETLMKHVLRHTEIKDDKLP